MGAQVEQELVDTSLSSIRQSSARPGGRLCGELAAMVFATAFDEGMKQGRHVLFSRAAVSCLPDAPR